MNDVPNPHAFTLTRLPQHPKPPFQSVVILGLAVLSSLLLMIGLPNLMPGQGIAVWIKTGVIGAGAVLVSYAVSRFAIERLAPLAAIGYRSALIGSIGAIAFVGAGLFSATYSGLTLPQVARLVLESHGVALGAYIADREQAAQQSGRVAPALAAIVGDLKAKLDCASRPACAAYRRRERISAQRELADRIGRAEAVSAAAEAGRAQRDAATRRLGVLLGDYQAIVRSSDKSTAETWLAAQRADAAIRQEIATLTEASPVALARAYAEELATDADASLRSRGASLKSVVDSAQTGYAAASTFPAPPGVWDTIGYIFHFLPLAAIAAVIDLVVPLLIWLIAFLSLLWAMRQNAPTPPRDPDDHHDALKHFMAGRDPVTHRTFRPGPDIGPRPNGAPRAR